MCFFTNLFGHPVRQFRAISPICTKNKERFFSRKSLPNAVWKLEKLGRLRKTFS
jgi:hypothetical protein